MIASPGWLDESKKADEPKSQFFACKGGPKNNNKTFQSQEKPLLINNIYNESGKKKKRIKISESAVDH